MASADASSSSGARGSSVNNNNNNNAAQNSSSAINATAMMMAESSASAFSRPLLSVPRDERFLLSRYDPWVEAANAADEVR